MKRLYIKYYFLLLSMFGAFFMLPETAFAASPNLEGYVLIAGTNAPAANIWVKWHDIDGNYRFAKTDSTGFYYFQSWFHVSDAEVDAELNTDIDTNLDGINDSKMAYLLPSTAPVYKKFKFACGQNPHIFTPIRPYNWKGTFTAIPPYDISNSNKTITLATSYFQAVIPTPTPIPPTPTAVLPTPTIDPLLPTPNPLTPTLVPPTPTPGPIIPTATPPVIAPITGTVFFDLNGNSIKDIGEAGIAGHTVTVRDDANQLIGIAISDAIGSYAIPVPSADTYTVTLSVPSGLTMTSLNPKFVIAGLTTPSVDFGLRASNSIYGKVFIDSNKNRIQDNGEVEYPDPIISESGNTGDTSGGSYHFDNLPAGVYNMTYLNLPADYQMVYPLNGPPPSFTVTLGQGICAVDSSTGGFCDASGNIENLNFAITDSIPWIQSKGLDMRFDSGISNFVPASPACTNPYASVPGSSTTSGLIFSGDQTPIFGKGGSSKENWVVGDSIYPELYKTTKPYLPSSYNSLLADLNRSGTPIINLQTICNITNCTLPNNLGSGAYQANGNLTLYGHKFKNNQNYVILVNGTLTILGDIETPNGSTVIFSTSQDIYIDRNVGINPTCTASTNLQGFFSADHNVIVQGINDCTVGADKMLQIEGGVFTNAAMNGGKFENNRDLCQGNLKYPSISFIERSDFIINAPNFLKRKGLIFQEIAP
jgi:hypothetical protein